MSEERLARIEATQEEIKDVLRKIMQILPDMATASHVTATVSTLATKEELGAFRAETERRFDRLGRCRASLG